jgi:hypothetical protein
MIPRKAMPEPMKSNERPATFKSKLLVTLLFWQVKFSPFPKLKPSLEPSPSRDIRWAFDSPRQVAQAKRGKIKTLNQGAGMAKYLGLTLEKDECLRCRCGKSYRQILSAGDYCSGCGKHRLDIEENVLDQVELPKIGGRQVAAVENADGAWVVGFEVKDDASQAELEGDDDARIGLRDWVKNVVGVDFMVDNVAILQV